MQLSKNHTLHLLFPDFFIKSVTCSDSFYFSDFYKFAKLAVSQTSGLFDITQCNAERTYKLWIEVQDRFIDIIILIL